MATRSMVLADIDGELKGRYVHWDGYPDGVGRALAAIVARDGYREAVRVLLVEHYGWSSVDAVGLPVLPRDRVVPGYGTAYDDMAASDWYTLDDDGGTEYAYVLRADRVEAHRRAGGSWEPLASLAVARL